MRGNRLFIVLVLVPVLVAACGEVSGPDNGLYPGQTDFVNTEPGSSDRGWDDAFGAPSAGAAESDANKAAPPEGPPQGREGEVEEADIYKVENNRLFYLNTYRGFIIYDVKDSQNPQLISRLPVYGYPIEMFIEKNTVYALIRDALYLTEVKGKLEFKRHNVSQLVAIDISDLKNPKVLKTVDIIGELREGVSRKIDNTVYVVSYRSQYYYWGWSYGGTSNQESEQAWVYSFNVADPKNVKLVDSFQIFEGGGYSETAEGAYASRWFSGVTISATSNALMVAENWYVYGSVYGSKYDCGTYKSQQQAIVSIIDISDPSGAIKLHTKFETYGSLGDQFKQTYIFDQATGKGTYLGIFARQEWSSTNCSGSSLIQNTLESWDITDRKNPKKIDDLVFGKPNETVRGSTFDPARRVVFAITARQVDPLYAISFADPADLKILSEIDGLSGDMNVFRLIENNSFLIGIGRDDSDTCTGFASQSTGWSTNVAVSIIDVQDLTKIRLVQRSCVAVKNASWVSSALNWNLDQGHKMIGMHSDGKANVISVPVYFYTKSDSSGWWWYELQTAVGLMSWDLSKYDPSKSELEQQVLTNLGTIIHPKGEVKRSVIFTHKGTSDRRKMINLSETHISVVDIENLTSPVFESIVEVAPYVGQLFRFNGPAGDFMVEHVQPGGGNYYYSSYSQMPSEFRVKKTPVGGKGLEDAPVVATFMAGQVERVVKLKDNLVLFRRIMPDSSKSYYDDWKVEIVVYNLSNPAKPVKAGSLIVPEPILPHYWYWCGADAYWGGYWYEGSGSGSWTISESEIVLLVQRYNYTLKTTVRKLIFLDVQNPWAPALKELPLSTASDWTFFGVVADAADPSAFYLSYRVKVGTLDFDGSIFNQYKYYAQRFIKGPGGWTGAGATNLPGRLIRTWKLGKERLFLTHDHTYKKVPAANYVSWQTNFRLNLLREISSYNVPLAELLDLQTFNSASLLGLVIDSQAGNRIFVATRPDYYYAAKVSSTESTPWYELSDQLTIFDISTLKLAPAFAAPTGTYYMRLMGSQQGLLFANLQGDGIVAIDTTNPSKPVGKHFVRTLGYASHIELTTERAYIASGYFGIYEMSLADGGSSIPAAL